MKSGLNNEALELLGESGEVFDAIIDESVPDGFAEKVKRAMRQSMVQDLTDLDRDIDSLKARAEDCARTCDGPLTMHAKRGDATYTVTGVCTSRHGYEGNQSKQLTALTRDEVTEPEDSHRAE